MLSVKERTVQSNFFNLLFVFSFCIVQNTLTNRFPWPCGFKTEGSVTHGCFGQQGTLNEVFREAWGPVQGI